ncbi:transposase [Ochrobactrum sp. Kaboul]|nr:transposase [Ochrobactrum sp. Kaboul]
MSWQDVPPKYGNGAIYRRFRRGSEARVWQAVSATLTEIMPTVATTASIALRFAPIFRQSAAKEASSMRSWPLAGRVHQ